MPVYERSSFQPLREQVGVCDGCACDLVVRVTVWQCESLLTGTLYLTVNEEARLRYVKNDSDGYYTTP